MTSPTSHNKNTNQVIKVLVVEDDFRVNEIHSTLVDRVPGFQVVAKAFSGEQAFRAIAKFAPDLVLLDIYLPDITGLEVIAKINLLKPPRPDVIIVSAAKDTASVRSAMQAGALHFLTKPFDSKSLTERLRSYQIFRSEIDTVEEVDQAMIDKLWTSIRSFPEAPLPKGHSQHTTELVIQTLSGTKEDLTAEEVARRSGLSRTSTQRYLSYLTRLGKVEVNLKYGATGRPEHLYRWK